MRKVILALSLVLAASSAAQAQHRHYHGGGGGHRSGGGWVAPLVGGLIVGGMVGSVLSQPSYAAPPPVYYVEQPRYRRCWMEPVFDRYTNQYLGEQKICQNY